MKKYFSIAIALFSLIALVGCREKLREEVVTTYENGQPAKVYYYNKENQWVREVDFHENGAVYIEGEIKNDQRTGEWTSYFLDGKVQSKGYYVDGLRTGKALVYHENGQLWMDGSYSNDHQCGEWIYYDEQGYEVMRKTFGPCD